MFEDAEAGVEAALAGNMYCIAIGDPEHLGQAHRVIQSFLEIPDPAEALLALEAD